MNEFNNPFSANNFGPNGIFFAILISIASTFVLSFFYEHRLVRRKFITDDADPTVAQNLSAVEPAVLTLLFFVLIRILLTLIGVTDINQIFINLFVDLFNKFNSGFISGIMFNLIVHILWFFGIHGSNVLEPVAQNIFAANLVENMDAVAQGLQPQFILTKPFFDIFVFQGGAEPRSVFLPPFFSARRAMSPI
nr:PTS transporter subunit EIIC [Brucepastera parasyntrophica]